MNKKIIYNMVDNFVDFPNKYSLTLFFSGCNLCCPFCYNKHVVNENGNFTITDAIKKKNDIENNFKKMKIGIVFSGGEPTIQNDFEKIINIFRDNPLAIHTNGLTTPNTKNVFESVVLSLKSHKCNTPKNYIDRFIMALDYYKGSSIKKISVVKYPDYMDEFMEYISQLEDYISKFNYEIKFVDHLKI